MYSMCAGPDDAYEMHVAVKTLRDMNSLELKKLEEFFREALNMKKLKHENVLEVTGIAVLENTPHIVLPYMEMGDLKNYVKKAERRYVISCCLTVRKRNSGLQVAPSKITHFFNSPFFENNSHFWAK